MLRRFLSYYKPHRLLFAVDLISAFLRAGFMMVVPFIVVKVLEREKMQGLSLQDIRLTIAVLTTLVFLMAFTEFINIKWGHILGTRIETDMRADLFRHLQKLSFGYFDKTKTGHIMSRISNDLMLISELAHHAPEDFIISTALIVGSLTFMFIMNRQMAVIVALPLPLLLIWGNVFRVRLRRTFRAVRRKVADINTNVENAIQGIREVQSYVKEDYAINQFDAVNNEFKETKVNMYHTMAGFQTGIVFLLEFYSVVIIGGGLLLIHSGKLGIVELLGFMMYRRYMFQPIRRLTGFIEQLQQGAAAFERFVEIMDIEPEISDRPDALTMPEPRGEIIVKDACFRYDAAAESPVLDKVNLVVRPGQTVALVGESGAGKSTLASLIPRFYELQRGSITIDGVDVMRLRLADLRRNIGIVRQDVFLFDATIRDNIMFANPGAGEEALIAAAGQAHIYDFIAGLPDGFDTLVGERGVMLSGGQKQRISMARVFLKDPAILIFDEATSSLDSESEVLIQRSLDELCYGRSTLVIAHRLSTVRNADYTYVMRQGKIVEHGTHDDLIKLKGYYYDLYNRNAL